MKKFLLLLFVLPFVAFGQGAMDFENVTLPTAYEDGTFTENGITYTYAQCRDHDVFPITNNGLMLRKPLSSYFEWTVPDGVGELSFEYRKAFTGGAIRQLEVIVNGTQVTVGSEFGEGTGEQTDIYTLTHNINLSGALTIRIKNVGDADANRQSIIDNIVWTAFEGGVTCDAPTNLSFADVNETSAIASWDAGGSETEWLVIYGPAGFDFADYSNNTAVTEITTIDNPYSITGLTAETGYDVYVIAKCDGALFSDELGPVSFTTQTSSIDKHVFNNFSFYPNPVQNTVNLKAGSIIENVQVYDMLGKNSMTISPNTLSTKINTQQLQKGVYIMKVTINGTQETYRIIKK